jgi:hypothetical protein
MSFKFNKAPAAFNGTLGELYDGWAKYVLLDPSVIVEFHKQFCAYYLDSADPLFIVRKVTNQERGHTLRTEHGVQFRPTDNSPAWWIHYQIFSGQFRQDTSFAAFVESIPCHIHNVRLPENINKAGWHVAHIFNVKNRDVGFSRWDRTELVRRTTLNIHPCNYFYIPKYEWKIYGSDRTVIAFFYDKFKSLYRTIWKEFLRLVESTPIPVPIEASEYRYSFSTKQKDQEDAPRERVNPKVAPQGYLAKYSYSRLCFKANMIEPLGMDDKFCIESNAGTFVMSKREFYESFSNVLKSKSYLVNKIYHYPKPPQKALQFKLNF